MFLRAKTTVAVATLAAAMAFASQAHAATVHVSTAGADGPACGPLATPCASVAQAVTNSVTGDTVQIGPGTFSVASIVIGLKDLTINGSGAGSTVLDGELLPGGSTNGMLRYTGAGTSTQTVSNLALADISKKSGGYRYGIIAIPPVSGSSMRSVNLTVENVNVVGSGETELAVWSNHNAGSVMVDGLAATGFGGNAVLLEQHIGPATVKNSSIASAGPSYGIFDMTYSLGTADATATGAHAFTGNTFNGTAGIGVSSGIAALAPLPFTGGVTISDNTFNSTATSGVAIGVGNTSSDSGGGAGDVAGLVVAGNRLAGSGNGTGIRLRGKLTAPTIGPGNNIRGYDTGVAVLAATAGHSPGSATVRRNQIVGNATAGVTSDATSVVDATDNWWGCNAGPGAAGCDAIAGTGTTLADPRVVLGIAADPANPRANGTATVTAGLTRNSLGTPVDGVIANGTALAFSALGGAVAPASVGMQSASATTAFTSSAETGRRASASYDNQTVNVDFTDVEPPIAAVLKCLGKPLIVTDVTAWRNKVRIRGTADPKYAGRTVTIQFEPTGRRTVARARVRANGTFTADAPRPARRLLFSDDGRYRALISGSGSPWLRVIRRIEVSTLKAENGKLVVAGRLVRPLRRGARVAVRARVDCGRTRVIARLRVDARGRFSGRIAPPPSDEPLLARLSAEVKHAGNGPFVTFSIENPVLVPPAG